MNTTVLSILVFYLVVSVLIIFALFFADVSSPGVLGGEFPFLGSP
jgi:hypothetical protein